MTDEVRAGRGDMDLGVVLPLKKDFESLED